MKTLVIHPNDITTGFLKVIYEGKDWTIISDNVSTKKLKENIKSHDRIIMLGHGTENGLIGHSRFIINSNLVYLLRDKIGVYIWCNADEFVKKYNLKGFYTGMIVSDREESDMFFLQATLKEIDYSNMLFADSVKNSIDSDNILESMSCYDDTDNEIILFNKQNLFHSM